MSCHHGTHSPTTRRELLSRCALGFGSVALTSLLGERAFGNLVSDTSPLSPKPPHFAPKVKRVIYLYMDGAPSQVDTFDPKPRLDRE
ncbi:MAG: sulfatase, partial [Planctomycetes bacterium]|nr:sulfatase [Planctomycetota bacterium]